MSLPYFTFKIGGLAGQGIKSAGLMFAKVASRSGYWAHNHTEYPSLIRGGHNVMGITISTDPVHAPTLHTNLLIALNQETVTLHYQELISGAYLLYDSGAKLNLDLIPPDVRQIPIPLNQLAREAGGGELISNVVALGAACTLLSADLTHLLNLIDEEFADKDPQIRETNHKAAQSGANYLNLYFKQFITPTLRPLTNPQPKIVVNADDTVALAAVAAGLQFASIYPMTPISNILHTLAPLAQKYEFIYKQPEDEIAAINMAIGASFAGARSMVATSGGGFCLMTEGFGLAGMTETPIVVILGMRGGPSTGLPTWSEQSDLHFLLHASQGEFPRLILAAGDPEEAFFLTLKAFNLADKYQTPVVVIVDKNICEDDQTYFPFDTLSLQIDRGKIAPDQASDYKRYALSPDGISPRALPGSGYHLLANSDEHDEIGYSNEEAHNRIEQMDKRLAKLATCAREDLTDPQVFGPTDADLTIVSWGSNKGSVLEAIKRFDRVNYLHLTWMNPFPADFVKDLLSRAHDVLNIECNPTAQLAALIREKTGIEITNHFLKYDGRPVYPEEIIEKIDSLLSPSSEIT